MNGFIIFLNCSLDPKFAEIFFFGIPVRNEQRGEKWMFPKIGGKPPKWMVKIMVPNPIKIDYLGGFPIIFGNTLI